MGKLIINIDGASAGNPGPSGIGVVISDGENIVKRLYKHIGETTNNLAEYIALIYALQEAVFIGAKEISIKTDSELLAKQISGEYKVKDKLIRIFYDLYLYIKQRFDKIEVKQIDRSLNKEADRLANKAIEERFDMGLKAE